MSSEEYHGDDNTMVTIIANKSTKVTICVHQTHTVIIKVVLYSSNNNICVIY